MIRALTTCFLFAACGAPTVVETPTAPAATSEDVVTEAPAADATVEQTETAAVDGQASGKNIGAPVEFSATLGERESTITIAYGHLGDEVQVEAWGATGLKVGAEQQLWLGSVEAGDVQTYTIAHEGSGDLALRVTGRFAGQEVTRVHSYEIGTPERTEVPATMIDGQPVRGWEGTRR